MCWRSHSIGGVVVGIDRGPAECPFCAAKPGRCTSRTRGQPPVPLHTHVAQNANFPIQRGAYWLTLREEAVMIAALLCLPVLLMLTNVCLARPLRYSVFSQSCRPGRQPMPDLNALILRSSPRVFATGRLIKGLYYAEVPKG